MHEYPDIYADGYSLSVGPFGCTLTLLRSEPPLDSRGPQVPSEIVARLRLSAPLATAVAEALARAVAASMPGTAAAATTPGAGSE